LLPVAQAPLISYSLRWLAAGGRSRVFVCLNEATRGLRERLGDGSDLGLRIEYSEDGSPRGAAGCARDVALSSDAESFVICDGTVVPTVEQEALLEFHRGSGAAMTVVAHRDDLSKPPLFAPLSPAGIYVAERRVFDHVAESGFQDIKENLIPRLHQADLPVLTYLATGCCPRVVDARTYLTVNHWLISRVVSEQGAADGSNALSPAGEVLAHPTAWVDPGARLLGPILLGPGVRVQDGATIVGPASIGRESMVAEGAVISRSIAWDRCIVGPNALLDACVLADDARVEAGSDLFGTVVTASSPRRTPAWARWASPEAEPTTVLPWALRLPASRPR
jgi:NDP-sugar pyrophosphorylase family protein